MLLQCAGASCHAADSLQLKCSIYHHLQDDSGEEEEESESDDDMEEEEEEGGLRRYSLRDRSRALVQRYSPRAGAAGAFSVGLKRRRSIVEQVPSHARVAGLGIRLCRPYMEEEDPYEERAGLAQNSDFIMACLRCLKRQQRLFGRQALAGWAGRWGW